LKCPIDGNPLVIDRAEAHSGFGCLSCKGSWLPKNILIRCSTQKNLIQDLFGKNYLINNIMVTALIAPQVVEFYTRLKT